MRTWPSGEPEVLAAEASSSGGGAVEPEPDLGPNRTCSLICVQHILALRIKRILPFETSVDISEGSSSSLSPFGLINTKCIAYLCLASRVSILGPVMQSHAFEINGSSVSHALLGLGSAHTREEIIPRVYSMSGSVGRSRWAREARLSASGRLVGVI